MSPRMIQGSDKAVEFPSELEWFNVEKPMTLADFKGKLLLLDFWTYCCVNCMHVLPELHILEQRYPELAVVGVHSPKFENEKVSNNVLAAIERYEVEHPVVVDNQHLLWKTYGVHAWPSFVLLAPSGEVLAKGSGEGILEKLDHPLEPYIKDLLEHHEANEAPIPSSPAFQSMRDQTLRFPGKVVADEERNRLFLSDSNHNRVLVLDLAGNVLDVIGDAGKGSIDGKFEECAFFRPQGLAYDNARNSLFIADTDNHLVRVADLEKRIVSTVMGTNDPGRWPRLAGRHGQQEPNSPWNLALEKDSDKDVLYIAMAGWHQIWALDVNTGQILDLYGSGREGLIDGLAAGANLAQPSGMDCKDGIVYFADSETSSVRLIENGKVSTLVGKNLYKFGDLDGSLAEAMLQHPMGIHCPKNSDLVYVCDTFNHKIKVIDTTNGTIRTVAGTGTPGIRGGPALEARFWEPSGITSAYGKLYICDTNNHRLRVLDTESGIVSTLDVHQ